jgi:hypothetical protein
MLLQTPTWVMWWRACVRESEGEPPNATLTRRSPVPIMQWSVQQQVVGYIVYHTCEPGNRERAAVLAVGKAAREAKRYVTKRGLLFNERTHVPGNHISVRLL